MHQKNVLVALNIFWRKAVTHYQNLILESSFLKVALMFSQVFSVRILFTKCSGGQIVISMIKFCYFWEQPRIFLQVVQRHRQNKNVTDVRHIAELTWLMLSGARVV